MLRGLSERSVRAALFSYRVNQLREDVTARSGDAGSSRKMGVYYMATLLFKIYFKVSRRLHDYETRN